MFSSAQLETAANVMNKRLIVSPYALDVEDSRNPMK